jgi:hypothetical protein
MFPHLWLWLMRPKLRPGGHTTEKTARPGEPFGCSPGVAAPLVSPRSVERNYKDTTNGARTLTAKPWAVGLGKAFGLGVGMFFERGGAFRLVQDNALQQDGKKVHYFYIKSSARGLETVGRVRIGRFGLRSRYRAGSDSSRRRRSSKSSCLSCIFRRSS